MCQKQETGDRRQKTEVRRREKKKFQSKIQNLKSKIALVPLV
jgi:hypothetical protein